MNHAATDIVINPNTGRPVTAGQAFAAWLEQHEPDLFQALLKDAAAHGAIPKAGLGDWSSILSDIGSGISDAASSVGDYLTSSQGMQSLTGLANTYLQSQTAQAVTQMQVSRAQQGLAPAPVSYAVNSAGQTVPVYTGSTVPSSIAPYAGQPVNLGGTTAYPLSSQALAALSGGSTLTKYMPWILAGGGALLLFGLLAMRK
ncbi:MAG: hypothetical protein ACREJ2_11735 [Planctomycetota bacterium]